MQVSAPPQISCLFWNLNRQVRDKLIVELASHIEADIVVLAEHGGESDATLRALQVQLDPLFTQPPYSLNPRRKRPGSTCSHEFRTCEKSTQT